MATVDLLYEGYVKEGENFEIVRNSLYLVKDGDKKIIVDPGLVESPQTIIDALHEYGLKIDDINYVYITHCHMDHIRYLGLFSNATIIDYKYIYKGEKWSDHDGDGYQITNDVSIIHTPGHTMDDSTLLVKTQKGIVAISHVWWFPDKTPEEDPMATDQVLLNKSRKKVEEVADWIGTPHGGLMQIEKK